MLSHIGRAAWVNNPRSDKSRVERLRSTTAQRLYQERSGYDAFGRFAPASALNHPNILTIHEIGQDDTCHFMATEYWTERLGQVIRGTYTLGKCWISQFKWRAHWRQRIKRDNPSGH